MDLRPLVEGYIANFGISLYFLSFSVLDDFLRFYVFLVFVYCGIGATIRIGRGIRCLPYAGFFKASLQSALFFTWQMSCQSDTTGSESWVPAQNAAKEPESVYSAD